MERLQQITEQKQKQFFHLNQQFCRKENLKKNLT